MVGPLAGNETGMLDHLAQSCIVREIASTGSAHHVLFDHDASHVVYVESQTNAPEPQRHSEPLDLHVVGDGRGLCF